MKTFASIALLTLACMIASPAAAQSSVVIWPVDPQIKAGEQATALWLENRGSEPVTMQIRSFSWDQSDGEDSYRPQDTIVSSPPIASVRPGERQLVRVIRRTPDAPGERAYRLVIDELPKSSQAGEGAVTAHLAVQMRYSIPLFTFGDKTDKVEPNLSSRLEIASGKRWLVLTNSGAGHARLTDLRSGSIGAAHTLKAGLIGYVLPGATMRWELPDDLANDPVFTVAVNGSDQTLGRAS
jgi:fimbrial chaperone protein